MTLSPLAPVQTRGDDRAIAIAAATDDLELAVRLMHRLRARLKQLLVESPQDLARDLTAVGATMPEHGLAAAAGVEDPR